MVAYDFRLQEPPLFLAGSVASIAVGHLLRGDARWPSELGEVSTFTGVTRVKWGKFM